MQINLKLKAMKTDLEKQIEALKIEHEHKTTTSNNLGEIKHLAYVSEWKDRKQFMVNVKCKDLTEAKKVLDIYQPTNKTTVIGTAGDKYHKNLKTPFNVKLENPPVCNSAQNYNIELRYKSGKNEVTIKLPIEFIKDMLTPGERHITDSEYHYFTGYSYEKLRILKIRDYRFKNCLNDEVINWYGGDQTLCKISLINEIVKRIETI